MTKEAWYADRIGRRVVQHRLFEKQCFPFEGLDEPKLQALKQARYTGKPILVFFGSADCWTLLTTNEIISFFEGKLRTAMLDEIAKEIELIPPSGTKVTSDLKERSDRLLLVRSNVEIWAPMGAEIFGLMNILQMFPLKTPCY